ncbi:hypothetical protein [Mastigocoleus testarum]|uniref:Glycosyltransferase n=1 Tax=Mastigocoleus testarum BC008 TaxID=371196 RepID=A0A0V7ZFV3_9CYAN|nr:hypothetical protein [Mastigocoleus testarum]KST63244.1 hypothetical protein BC008_38825 [Mastigocoleus testarum BC008]
MTLQHNEVRKLSLHPNEITAKTELEKFDCVYLINPHTFGTGRQRVMYNLIYNLARLGCERPVHLFYNQWKTKLWYAMLGYYPQGLEDYHNHFYTWQQTLKGMTIWFHPIPMEREYTNLLCQFKECMKDESAEHFWFSVWRDDAPGCELDAFKANAIVESIQLPKQSYLKFYKHSPLFQDLRREEIPKARTEKRSSYCPHALFTNNLRTYVNKGLHLLPKQDPNGKSDGNKKILTMFAACDNFTHVQEVLIPDIIQNMTAEAQPCIIILQSFLWWSKQLRPWPCLVKGDLIAYLMDGPPKSDTPLGIGSAAPAVNGDRKKEHHKLLLPIYPSKPDRDLLSQLNTIPASAENYKNKLIQNIITLAREEIELISVYYTEHRSHLCQVTYSKLLDALRKVMEMNPNPYDKPVVIAFLGEDRISSNLPELAALLKGESNPEEIHEIIKKKRIVWQSFGRTNYIPLFQQYSLFFVTEGANTWQETLSIGKPTLSVNPNGDTQPWNHDWLNANGANLVKDPSEELVALALNPKENNLSFNKLSQFIRDVRVDESKLCLYFQKWSEILNKHECNQVVTALCKLSSLSNE